MKPGPKPRPVAERLWPKVLKGGPKDCWLFTGATDGKGYGSIGVGPHETDRAHRVSYRELVGPIPEGLTLDHLCRNRRCVNPAHLEPVTMYENWRRGESLSAQNARKTHCKYGHEFTPDNTRCRITKRGRLGRSCRTCDARLEAERTQRRRLQVAA